MNAPLHPYGPDPADLPPEPKYSYDQAKDTMRSLSSPTDGGRKRSSYKAPSNQDTKIQTQEEDPIRLVGQMFDICVAAGVLQSQEFDFGEIYTSLIDIFRNDPDPKIRMAAGERLCKMLKDCLITTGGYGKVTESVMSVQSPDGKIAARQVVSRRMLKSFEDANRKEDPPAEAAPFPSYLLEGAGPPGPADPSPSPSP